MFFSGSVRKFRMRKGLDLPLARPRADLPLERRNTKQIGLMGHDYPFKPHFLVAAGDKVKRGQPLFSHKDEPRILVMSPVSGTVAAINRGERRAFESLVLEVQNTAESVAEPYSGRLQHAERTQLREYLQQKGAWVYLRTRPFSHVPAVDAEPAAIFINAMDTRPGALPVRTLLAGREAELKAGLDALAALTTNPVYFCESPADDWSVIAEQNYPQGATLQRVQFAGPHPAGLSSTHIHFLRPASLKHTVWTITAKHVADMGAVLLNGILPNTTRLVVSGQERSVFLETLTGARVSELVGDFMPHERDSVRVISGNVLNGWQAAGAHDFVGIFHNQVMLLPRETKRHFLQWLRPGLRSYSITRTVFGRYRKSHIDWNTSLNGGERALVPIGSYERVMPLDILITPLLRALLTGDTDLAAELGALELEEEDLSLVTYVCPGKKDYGELLRNALTQIYKETA